MGAKTVSAVGEVGAKTATAVGEVGAKTVTAVGSGLKKGLATARAGLDKAGEKLEAENQEWEARRERTDMPGIGRADPLGDLAERLDKQADFFRELAVDAMRPGLVRGALVALVLSSASAATLGAVAMVARIFLGGAPIDGLVELGTATAGAALAAALLGWVVERGRARVANEALARAEHAEARLCRLAELIALEKHDPDALVRALSPEREKA
jgi:hypothetical protein